MSSDQQGRPELHRDRSRASSFGDDAELYDRARPSYPSAMVDDLLAAHPQRVLDVGCGTGIAAQLFVDRGCDVLGVEPDERMAAVARRRGITVELSAFEEWDDGGRRFDLLVSGQAWHWVEPVAGARKAAKVLVPGGRFGLFWNRDSPAPELRGPLDEVYQRHVPGLRSFSRPRLRSDVEQRRTWVEGLREHGGFVDVDLRIYESDWVYDTEQCIAVLSTHSDHLTMDPDLRARLLDDVRRVIDEAGGRVPIHDETLLVTGTRPS